VLQRKCADEDVFERQVLLRFPHNKVLRFGEAVLEVPPEGGEGGEDTWRRWRIQEATKPDEDEGGGLFGDDSDSDM